VYGKQKCGKKGWPISLKEFFKKNEDQDGIDCMEKDARGVIRNRPSAPKMPDDGEHGEDERPPVRADRTGTCVGVFGKEVQEAKIMDVLILHDSVEIIPNERVVKDTYIEEDY
jgi:hypothetical protein